VSTGWRSAGVLLTGALLALTYGLAYVPLAVTVAVGARTRRVRRLAHKMTGVWQIDRTR
jgi:hypothetical protein